MKERDFEVKLPDGRMLRGLEFGDSDRPPIWCFHGWQDNAESFRPLAQELTRDHRLICIEFAGHGKSDPLKEGADYTFFQYVQDFKEAFDAIAAEEPQAFIGHSLGAAVLLLAAATFPEHFESLVVIDALGPLSESAELAPQRLRSAIEFRSAKRVSTPRLYPGIESVIQKRLEFGPNQPELARPIIERNFDRTEGGWKWRMDRRVKFPTYVRMTEEQIVTFLKQVKCPVLGLRARSGWPPDEAVLKARREAIPFMDFRHLDGPHHLHMSSATAVAAAIQDFWAK
jgi:pimeloyl-ACP methyl ester carboxylesterase